MKLKSKAYKLIFFIIFLVNIQIVFGKEMILINKISVVDFTEKPLSINDAGDLTLIDTKDFKLFYYPSENYFLLSLFKPQSYQVARNDINKLLGTSISHLCKLPIKLSSSEQENFEDLCSSSLFFDLNSDGVTNKLDLNIFVDQYKKAERFELSDFNFDQKLDSLDYSLLYFHLK